MDPWTHSYICTLTRHARTRRRTSSACFSLAPQLSQQAPRQGGDAFGERQASPARRRQCGQLPVPVIRRFGDSGVERFWEFPVGGSPRLRSQITTPNNSKVQVLSVRIGRSSQKFLGGWAVVVGTFGRSRNRLAVAGGWGRKGKARRGRQVISPPLSRTGSGQQTLARALYPTRLVEGRTRDRKEACFDPAP